MVVHKDGYLILSAQEEEHSCCILLSACFVWVFFYSVADLSPHPAVKRELHVVHKKARYSTKLHYDTALYRAARTQSTQSKLCMKTNLSTVKNKATPFATRFGKLEVTHKK